MKLKSCQCGCGNPAPIARVSNVKWGHIKGKPVRFIHGHHTRKALPEITALNLHWLAGILEGEGSFIRKTYHRTPKYGSPWKQVCSSLQVSMNDEDVIARVALLIGSSYWPSGKMFSTCATGPRAVSLMNSLLPLMGKRRRDQIERALSGQTKPRSWKMVNRSGTPRKKSVATATNKM